MKVRLFTLLMFIFASAAHAQWLCRDASSIRSGQTITACGVGQSQSLEDARSKSRESAIEEFKRICNESADCFEFDYTINPKRTDCEIKSNIHTCYRALDFEIGTRKRKSISLDTNELESELKNRNQEIQAIQNRIEKINQIKQSEQEAESKKQELRELESSLNKKEAEAVKLEDLNSKDTIESGGYRYLHQIYKNSIKVSFHYWASKLTSTSQNDIMWLAAYEKRPYGWLGFQIYGGFGRGNLPDQKTDDSVPTMGPSSSTQNYNGSVAYLDLGLGLLVYPGWRGVYLKSDLGIINGRKESYTVSYNGAGVGTPQKNESKFSASYVGAHIGFDTRDDKKGWGVYFELGARKVSDQSNPGFMGGLGVNYGF